MNPALRLVKPEKDIRSVPERVKDDLDKWLEGGPGLFIGRTPIEPSIAAIKSFAAHSGARLVTNSAALDKFEIMLDRAGFRANCLKYSGGILYILILPGHEIEGIE